MTGLPAGWKTRTGPRRWQYLMPLSVFVIASYALFIFGFAVQAQRDGDALDYARSDGGALEFEVDEAGTWSVFIDLHPTRERSAELQRALDGRTSTFRHTLHPVGNEDAQIPLRATAGSNYRITGGIDAAGYAIGEASLVPGHYVLDVAAASPPSEPAVLGFAVGPTPFQPSPIILFVAVAAFPVCAIWALIIRLRRRGFAAALAPPLPHSSVSDVDTHVRT